MQTQKLSTYYFMIVNKTNDKTIIGVQTESKEDAYMYLSDFYKDDIVEYIFAS